MYACTLAQTVPLLSKRRDKSSDVFSKTVLAACRFIPRYLAGKYKDSVGQKAHCLSAHELIYVKTMETACVNEGLTDRRQRRRRWTHCEFR